MLGSTNFTKVAGAVTADATDRLDLPSDAAGEARRREMLDAFAVDRANRLRAAVLAAPVEIPNNVQGLPPCGVGDQEAFELLQIWGFTFYGLAYLALFAIPLLARKERGIRPGLWLRFAAASGFLVTLLFVLLSIFPIISVRSDSAYAIKTAAVLIGANALGLFVYHLGPRGRSPSNAA